MKDTETDKDNAAEVQNSSNLDEESAEMLKAAYRKENTSSEDQGDEYRIWRCNGLPIGLRIHKKRP